MGVAATFFEAGVHLAASIAFLPRRLDFRPSKEARWLARSTRSVFPENPLPIAQRATSCSRPKSSYAVQQRPLQCRAESYRWVVSLDSHTYSKSWRAIPDL